MKSIIYAYFAIIVVWSITNNIIQGNDILMSYKFSLQDLFYEQRKF